MNNKYKLDIYVIFLNEYLFKELLKFKIIKLIIKLIKIF